MSSAAAPPADTAPARKLRHLMTHTLNIAISPARCQSHMKAILSPPDAEAALAEKRAAAAGGDATNKAEIDAIAGTIVRIGADAPVVMAAMVDYTIHAFARHAYDQTVLAQGRLVDVSSLHAGDPTVLDFWPLVCSLDVIRTYDPENEAALKAQRAAANKALKEALEQAAAEKPAAEKPPAAAEKPAAEGDNAEPSFRTYVNDALMSVVRKRIRVSQRLRDVLSTVAAELVERFSRIAKVGVLDFLEVRTLNAKHLLAIIKIAFATKTGDENGPRELLAYIDAKVDLYNRHLASEKERKLAEMAPAKRVELAAKEAEAAAAKKKREADSAAVKAIAMAQKAEALAAEASEAAGGN